MAHSSLWVYKASAFTGDEIAACGFVPQVLCICKVKGYSRAAWEFCYNLRPCRGGSTASITASMSPARQRARRLTCALVGLPFRSSANAFSGKASAASFCESPARPPVWSLVLFLRLRGKALISIFDIQQGFIAFAA